MVYFVMESQLLKKATFNKLELKVELFAIIGIGVIRPFC